MQSVLERERERERERVMTRIKLRVKRLGSMIFKLYKKLGGRERVMTRIKLQPGIFAYSCESSGSAP